MHGLELVLEAVRQVRGASTNQVPRNDVASLSEVRWLRQPAIFFSDPKLPCNERSE